MGCPVPATRHFRNWSSWVEPGMSPILQVPSDPGHEFLQDQEREGDFPTHPWETKRKKKLTVDDSYHYDQVEVAVKNPALELAEEFRANLPVDNPSFLKTMVRSNVVTGFWLHLPMPFCKMYMPRHNTTVSLVDEKGEEYRVSYIVDKTALSAGWKKFSSAWELLEGDVAVFQLVKPSVFKVYIIKADHSKQDGRSFVAANTKQINYVVEEILPGNGVVTKKKAEDVLPETTQDYSNVDSGLVAPQLAANTSGLDAIERNGLPECNHEFEEAANHVDEFSVLVSGVSINKELSRYHRAIYHELCCSQDMILHDNLLRNISRKLAAEMISETVNIAEAIGSCSASTPREEYEVWDRTLQGFELLGMKVAFLRARLEKLTHVNSELKKYRDAVARQDSVKKEVEIVRGRVRKLRKLTRRLDNKIEELRDDAEKHEKAFREAATAPW
ncbi:hypothetical protein MLD38_026991 [Melastoma candidum]|uniref:Uncharacterized protein n=1 Tax=Melastoma candidum TaxID=119954 RepID=A0ACB9P3Q0_9MYRT|nr:hypothetical protein MLD38_026991 [Melastoma candidum]